MSSASQEQGEEYRNAYFSSQQGNHRIKESDNDCGKITILMLEIDAEGEELEESISSLTNSEEFP